MVKFYSAGVVIYDRRAASGTRRAVIFATHCIGPPILVPTYCLVIQGHFRIFHPIIKDAETVRFGILLLCQERSIVILNCKVGCSAFLGIRHCVCLHMY
jgi:hypothetical protein